MDKRIAFVGILAKDILLKKHVARTLIVAGLLTLFVLAACGPQAPEKPASDAAAEQSTDGDEEPVKEEPAAEEPAEEEPTSAPEVAAQPDCEPASDEVLVVDLGSPPLEACVTSDVPTQSYVFNTSVTCPTQISLSATAADSSLTATLQDPTSELILETASMDSSETTFELPADALNELQANFFQIDVSMDADSAVENESFSIAVEELCDEETLPVVDLGLAAQMNNPVTFSTDSGIWSLQHPAGWGIEVGNDGSINLANDPALLDAVNADDFVIAAGQMGLTILFIPADPTQDIGVAGANSAEAAAVLSQLIAPTSEESLATVGEVELLQHEGHPVLARVMYGYGDVYEGMTVVWDIAADGFGAAVVMAPPGETASVEETIFTILESVEFHSSIEDVLSSLIEENE